MHGVWTNVGVSHAHSRKQTECSAKKNNTADEKMEDREGVREQVQAPEAAISRYVTSEDWLKEYGLEACGLSMHQILSSHGFRQCSGSVKLQDQSVSISSRYSQGVFLQHPDTSGTVYNLVRIGRDEMRALEGRLAAMVTMLKARLKWLNTGSRKVFGVVSECRVVLAVVDGVNQSQATQKSINLLLQEQSPHWTHTNVLRSGSQWGEGLVEVTADTSSSIIQWLSETTSTDKMKQKTPPTSLGEAVVQLTRQKEVDAVYLLIDGNSCPQDITKLEEQLPQSSCPVHVVCIDCSSQDYLEHCHRLATACGGRCLANSSESQSLSLPRPAVLALWDELEKAQTALGEVEALQIEAAAANNRPRSSTTRLQSSISRPHSSTTHLHSSTTRPHSSISRPHSKPHGPHSTGPRSHSTSYLPHSSSHPHSSLCSPSASSSSPSSLGVVSQQRGRKGRRQTKGQTRRQTPPQAAAGEEGTGVADGIYSMENSSEGCSVKSWLQRHSLVTQRLTILDALGPSAIPHTPTHIPQSTQPVYGRVFRDIYPLAHLSSSGNMTLLNPAGCDLRGYEQRLLRQRQLYTHRLDQEVWSAIPRTVQQKLREELGLGEEEVPAYMKHRELLRSALASAGWPVREQSLALLEEEVAMADSFLSYSKAIREEVLRPVSTHSALPPSRVQRRRASKRPQLVMRGNRVLACCKYDGLYYPGTVLRCPSTRRVDVQFSGGHCQSTLLSRVLVVGGAGPHPPLWPGDYALCCVRSRAGWHCSEHGLCDSYLPSQIQAVPANMRCGHALYTVQTYSGHQITCTHSALVKISEGKYNEIHCRIVRAEERRSKETQTLSPILKDSHTNTSSQQASCETQTEEREGREVSVGTDPPPTLMNTHTNTEASAVQDRGTSTRHSMPDQAVDTGPLKIDKATATETTIEPVTEETTEPTTEQTTEPTTEQTAEPTTEQTTEPTTKEKRDDVGVDSTDFNAVQDNRQLEGCTVLGRWPDDGWFYRARVVGRGEEEEGEEEERGTYWILQTDTGDVAEVPTEDIITDEDDALHHTTLQSAVVALHPLFSGSYAPGTVISLGPSTCTVEFYDGIQAHLSRGEVYRVSIDCLSVSIQHIEECEEAWVGRAVVARRDSDGVFCPATVSGRLRGQSYELVWSDGIRVQQRVVHMFCHLLQPRALCIGDHVIAPAIPRSGVCLPAVVTGSRNRDGIIVKFADGQKQVVSPEHCFWITPQYYTAAVEYISRAFATENDMSIDSTSWSYTTSCTDI